MPASYYSNPIPQIIDGLLRGHELGLKMQQAARAQQEFMTNQALHNQEMSMNDIKYKMMMQDAGARPVGPGGTVQDYPTIQAPSMPISPGSSGTTGGQPQGDIYNLPTRPGPTMPGQQIDYQAPASTIQNRMLTPSMPISPGNQGPPPDVSNLPMQAGPTMPGQTFSYLRKADKSRLVERPDRFGNKSSYELPTAEEQQQRDIARRSAEYQAQEAEKVQAQIKGLPLIRAAQDKLEQEEEQRTLKLEGGGIPSPPEFAAIGIRPGTLLTQKKALAALETLQGLTKPVAVPQADDLYRPELRNLLTPGAGAAQPPAATPGQPDQTTTTLNIPGQIAQAGTPAAPGIPSAPPGMKLLKQGSIPEPTGEFGTYIRAELMKSGQTYQSAMKNNPDLISKAVGKYNVDKADPVLRDSIIAQRDFVRQMALRSIQDRETARQDTLRNQDRTALDRESTQHSKAFDEISKGADSQLDKILDAEKMVAGGSVDQALAIPKILTALISGQGSGVRITKAEMDSIAKARGIGGDIEGFFNKLTGKGQLTADQKTQIQSILNDVRDRIVQKKGIARQASDDIMNAPDRAGVLGAVKKGRDALDAYSAQGPKQGGGAIPPAVTKALKDAAPNHVHTLSDGSKWMKDAKGNLSPVQ